MTKFLYTNFLNDKNVYNLTQAYWRRLLKSVLGVHDYTQSPYINQLQKGEKEYDGNPIFRQIEINKYPILIKYFFVVQGKKRSHSIATTSIF